MFTKEFVHSSFEPFSRTINNITSLLCLGSPRDGGQDGDQIAPVSQFKEEAVYDLHDKDPPDDNGTTLLPSDEENVIDPCFEGAQHLIKSVLWVSDSRSKL